MPNLISTSSEAENTVPGNYVTVQGSDPPSEQGWRSSLAAMASYRFRELEREAFDNSFRFEELIVIVSFIWGISLYLARKNQTEHERRIIFVDALPPAVETLDLTFRP